MSGPGPHVEDTEPVPAEQRAARPRVEVPAYRSPAQRVNRAADDLVVQVRFEVHRDPSLVALAQVLERFDKAVKEAGA